MKSVMKSDSVCMPSATSAWEWPITPMTICAIVSSRFHTTLTQVTRRLA